MPLRLDRMGLELYVFGSDGGNAEALDRRILPELRAYGYECIEGFAKPDGLGELARRHGLRLAGVHASTSALQSLADLTRFAKANGSHDLCVSGPLSWNARGLSDYLATAKVLNEAGSRLSADGLRVHYHNHEFEFTPLDGSRTAFDVLMEATDSNAVSVCVDVGWAWAAGADVPALLARYGPRIGFVHLRDFARGRSVALGAGEVNLRVQLEAIANLPNLRELIVEHDPTTADPLGAMRESLEWLRNALS
ncbi:MAG: hypothetical protein AMXMBFR7_03830 [Planctomycetota bacterium]